MKPPRDLWWRCPFFASLYCVGECNLPVCLTKKTWVDYRGKQRVFPSSCVSDKDRCEYPTCPCWSGREPLPEVMCDGMFAHQHEQWYDRARRYLRWTVDCQCIVPSEDKDVWLWVYELMVDNTVDTGVTGEEVERVKEWKRPYCAMARAEGLDEEGPD